MKDVAENRLAKNIIEGKEVSLLFYLKTQCKDRGYFEKKEVDQNNSGKMEIIISRKIIGDDPDNV